MSQASEELIEIGEQLDSIRAKFGSSAVTVSLEKLEDAAGKVGKSWSGSWLDYHSRIYYRDFQSPPPGAHFSQEWGPMHYFTNGTTGDWAEYDYDSVRDKVYEIAGHPDLEAIRELDESARSSIENNRLEILSSISTALTQRDDPFLTKLKEDLNATAIPTAKDFVKSRMPTGQFISRDTVAFGQGFQSPPHLDVWGEVMAFRVPIKVCEFLSKIARQAASHLARQERYSCGDVNIGGKIFIGHGRSLVWKDLKEFFQDRLGLPWDEFNRLPSKGNIKQAFEEIRQVLEREGLLNA